MFTVVSTWYIVAHSGIFMYRKRSEHALCNRRTTPDHRIFSGHMSTWSLRSIFGVCSSTEVSWISVLLTPCEHLYSWQCILSFTDVLIKISSTQLNSIKNKNWIRISKLKLIYFHLLFDIFDMVQFEHLIIQI